MEQRFWILTDKSIEFLGGKVDHLIEKWEISKVRAYFVSIHFQRKMFFVIKDFRYSLLKSEEDRG